MSLKNAGTNFPYNGLYAYDPETKTPSPVDDPVAAGIRCHGGGHAVCGIGVGFGVNVRVRDGRRRFVDVRIHAMPRIFAKQQGHFGRWLQSLCPLSLGRRVDAGEHARCTIDCAHARLCGRADGRASVVLSRTFKPASARRPRLTGEGHPQLPSRSTRALR